MFYNALIQAFLADERLFTDVKAIVDCPLKVDPAEVMKACREKEPKDVLELLGHPGSDLDIIYFSISDKCRHGRQDFLLDFDSDATPHPIASLEIHSRSGRRKTLINTIGSGSEKTLKLPTKLLGGDLPTATRLPSALTVVTDRTNLKEERILQMASRGTGASRGLIRRATASGIWLEAPTTGEGPLTGFKTELISDTTKKTLKFKHHLRLKKLGEELIRLWPKFCRRVSTNWAPDRNSLIPLPRPFIVPGGRFIEMYYWDSYWIILGLLSSGLHDVAHELIENFLFCVERFGFIPNGLRKYYLDRSQPPLLSCMLRAYYHATKDLDFIRGALQLLEREYAWWMSVKHGHAVEIEIPVDVYSPENTKTVVLNRYYSLEVTPRPESYRIDRITGGLYQEYRGAADSLEEHYRAIRAAAESGWDFSSRWLRPAVEGQGESGIKPDIQIDKVLHKLCLVDIDTCYILPCDLNAFMFCLEEDLAFFANILGKTESEAKYLKAREDRRQAMIYFLWDPEREMWLDYDMKNRSLSCVISAASFVPLWAGINPGPLSDDLRIHLASRLSCIVRPYGVVATNITAGLQWDCPNVWAPNHHMAVDFLCGGRFWNYKYQNADTYLLAPTPGILLAANWSSRFVNTVLDRYELFGSVSEKYDCGRLGKSGVDGEYVTQDGFGWTNGSVLDLLEKFRTLMTPIGLYTSSRKLQDDFTQQDSIKF